MPELPGFMLTQTVTVRPYRGTSGKGDRIFDSPSEPIRAFVEDDRRKVRSSSTGQEVVSQTTGYLAAGAGVLGLFPAGSEVALPAGRVAEVITVVDASSGGLPTPDHLEIMLT